MTDSAQAQLLSVFETGVKRSTERLASLSGMPWDIHILSLDVESDEVFRAILARDTREFFGVSFDAPGEKYLVVFSQESSQALLEASTPILSNGRRPTPAMEESTLAEIANILIGGLEGELAARQGMGRIISGPSTMRGTKSRIYNQVFVDPAPSGQLIVNVLIHISSPQLAADCTLLLRLDSLNANFLLNTDPDKRPNLT
ncbi:MAG: hypothetical protein AAB036_04900 [Elusimicrobiota bacterium]